MAKYRTALPTLGEGIFVSYTGIETDLIFNRGIDLTGFASYPLLETEEGREMLHGYYAQLIDMARQKGVGVLLESLTWVANRDRRAAIGHNPASLKKFNIAAIDMIARLREEKGDLPTLLSAQVGPRGDGYAPTELMTADEAEAYHGEQIETISQTEADLVSACTLCYPGEAMQNWMSRKSLTTEIPRNLANWSVLLAKNFLISPSWADAAARICDTCEELWNK